MQVELKFKSHFAQDCMRDVGLTEVKPLTEEAGIE